MSGHTKKNLVVWHLLSNPWNSAITEYAISTIRSFEHLGGKNILTLRENTVAHKRAKKENLKVTTVLSFSFFELKKLRDLQKKINPDFIFLYGGKETFLARFLSFKKASFIRLRGYKLKNNFFDFLFPLAHTHLHSLLSPGIKLQKDLQKKLVRKKVYKLTLGCDDKVFSCLKTSWLSHRQVRKHLRPRILILGRLDPVKGHREFLKIFSKVLDNWSYVDLEKPYLMIIGKEENLSYKDLKDFIKAETKLSLGRDVLFRDQYFEKPELVQALQETSLGVIPSLWSEEICRVTQEFLLCGTPVCVSGVGSLNEALFENAGWTYDKLSQEKLIEEIPKWVRQASFEGEEERTLRAKRAKDLFSFEAMANGLSKILGL